MRQSALEYILEYLSEAWKMKLYDHFDIKMVHKPNSSISAVKFDQTDQLIQDTMKMAQKSSKSNPSISNSKKRKVTSKLKQESKNRRITDFFPADRNNPNTKNQVK